MLVNDSHEANANDSIVWIFPVSMVTKLLQFLNAFPLIVFTLSPISIDCNKEQYSKALFPIVVTDESII